MGDLLDLKALKEIVLRAQPDVVFHLAAQPWYVVVTGPLGTWATNVQVSKSSGGSVSLIIDAVVMVTTDKVYANQEWDGYREEDRLVVMTHIALYKAAAELAISSWRSSFCGSGVYQTPHLSIATARAGNVIGGGDWSKDRIVPDAMSALASGKSIAVRSPLSTRPWQHVLDPLRGYLLLAERLADVGASHSYASPSTLARLLSLIDLQELIETSLQYWA